MKQQIRSFERSLASAFCGLLLLLAAAPAASQDLFPTPSEHEFIMLGVRNVMLYHTATFEQTNEAYQVVLHVSTSSTLPTDFYYQYMTHEGWTWRVRSTDSFTLPQLASGDLSGFTGSLILRKEGQDDMVLSNHIPFTVERVMYYRRFDLSAHYPTEPSYLIFGVDTQVYMAHYLAKRGGSAGNPGARAFDNIVRIVYPDWLPPMPGAVLPDGNDLLRAVLEVKLPSVRIDTLPQTSPLQLARYPLTVNGASSYEGKPFQAAVLQVLLFDNQRINGDAAPVCRPVGMFCVDDGECCSSTCTNGSCVATCGSAGAACSSDTDCCYSSPTCFRGQCASCVPLNGFCQEGRDSCCEGVCRGGNCIIY